MKVRKYLFFGIDCNIETRLTMFSFFQIKLIASSIFVK